MCWIVAASHSWPVWYHTIEWTADTRRCGGVEVCWRRFGVGSSGVGVSAAVWLLSTAVVAAASVGIGADGGSIWLGSLCSDVIIPSSVELIGVGDVSFAAGRGCPDAAWAYELGALDDTRGSEPLCSSESFDSGSSE